MRIFNERFEQIATHVQHEPGRFSTQRVHIAAEKISGVERGAAWLLSQTRGMGAEAARWSEAVIEARGVEGLRAGRTDGRQQRSVDRQGTICRGDA